MLGTANYMAPEQVRAEKPDHRVDIFSFGVVLYELFSGRKAFAADSFAATLYKIVHDEPEPLDRLNSDVPPALAAAVARAMAKSREDRYQNVADLARDLESVYGTAAGADPRFLRTHDFDPSHRSPTRAATSDYADALTTIGEPVTRTGSGPVPEAQTVAVPASHATPPPISPPAAGTTPAPAAASLGATASGPSGRRPSTRTG